MPLQSKVIVSETSQLEHAVNAWLAEVDEIDIVSVTQSEPRRAEGICDVTPTVIFGNAPGSA